MDNTTNKENEIDKLVAEAENEAREYLKGLINENQISYDYYLKKEMEKILKEKGVDWKEKNNSVAID